jgi:hypothetical protein
MAAIGRERSAEFTTGTGNKSFHLASLGRDQIQLRLVQFDVIIGVPVGTEENMPSIGRPSGFGLVELTVGQLPRLTRGGIDHPDMPVLLWQISRSIEFVIGASNVAIRNAQFLFLVIFLALQSVGVFLAELADKFRTVGRPLETGEITLQIGQRSGLAAVDRNQKDLCLFLILAIGKKGDCAAIRRPARMGVGLFAISELARVAPIGRGQPQIGIFLFRLALNSLDAIGDLRAVRRNLRVARQLEVVEVISYGQLRGVRGLVLGHEGSPSGY